MAKVNDILKYVVERYPLENASNFDTGKIGLQFGSKNADVKKVIVCLDTTKDVIEEAIRENANLIISHHPFMFAPLTNLSYDSVFGQKLQLIFKNDLNIMAFHTNFDVGENGMNDALANILGLTNVSYITPTIGPNSFLRIGECEPTSLKVFCVKIKEAFKQPFIKVVGDLDRKVSKVGIVGGAGSSEFYEALKAECDVFITGQIPHHLSLEAKENNMSLVEVSHAVEYLGIKKLYEVLKEAFPEVDFLLSTVPYEPSQYL